MPASLNSPHPLPAHAPGTNAYSYSVYLFLCPFHHSSVAFPSVKLKLELLPACVDNIESGGSLV